MPRRASIPSVTDSAFFSDVTPLWVPPGQRPIPALYHEAIRSLAEWVGPSWPTTESHFFKIRHFAIMFCDEWTRHDWEQDIAWINEQKNDAKHIRALQASWQRFSIALGKGQFRRQRLALVQGLLIDTTDEKSPFQTNVEALTALSKGLEKFGNIVKIGIASEYKFGPIEYSSLPRKLPRKEIAIALALADLITYWRNDGYQLGTLCNPHVPCLSKNLPWKAIAKFVSANMHDCFEGGIDECKIQTLVTSLYSSVTRLSWFP
jgi:hypothetical protein